MKIAFPATSPTRSQRFGARSGLRPMLPRTNAAMSPAVCQRSTISVYSGQM